jgi:hypothetical protein
MQSWGRIAIVAVLLWIVGVAVWAYQPWTDTVPLVVPKGQPPRSVAYSCGRLVGSSDVKPSVDAVSAARPLAHKPCSGRTERRVLAVLDEAVGLAAMYVLLTRSPSRRNEVSAAP